MVALEAAAEGARCRAERGRRRLRQPGHWVKWGPEEPWLGGFGFGAGWKAERRHPTDRERIGSPTLQTPQ
jgi:hypothetical protein